MRDYRCVMVAAFAALSCVVRNSEALTEAAARTLENTAVRITATVSGRTVQRGFGFILMEDADSLYVVTARHVVIPDGVDGPPERLELVFQGASPVLGVRLNDDRRLDVALLKAPRPSAFRWKNPRVAGTVAKDDTVWIVGRGEDVQAGRAAYSGVVSEVLGSDISVLTIAGQPGISGGPLASNTGIVGLIISDDGQEVRAVDLGVVKRLVLERWLKVAETREVRLFPYPGVGGTLGLAAPLTFSGNTAEYDPFEGAGELFLDLNFSRSFGARASYLRGTLEVTEKTGPGGNTLRFRNHYSLLGGELLWYPETSQLDNRYYNATFYVSLGVYAGRNDPQLAWGAGPFEPLGAYPPVGDRVNEDFLAMSVGGGGGTRHGRRWTVGFDARFYYTSARYLWVDPDDPSDGGGWLVRISLSAALQMTRREPSLRVIR